MPIFAPGAVRPTDTSGMAGRLAGSTSRLTGNPVTATGTTGRLTVKTTEVTLKTTTTMKFTMAPLPYDKAALEPLMSRETIEYHYGKHYATYVDNLNRLTEGRAEADMTLDSLIRTAVGPVFNNAAQAWNHQLFFEGLTPMPTAVPDRLMHRIAVAFGSFETLEERFISAATGVFGSGWAWLVVGLDGQLTVMTTPNADTPLRDGCVPLLTADVWEHAYYIDYRNRRADYLKAVWKLVDWQKVDARLPE